MVIERRGGKVLAWIARPTPAALSRD
jgi:hypothetical protein